MGSESGAADPELGLARETGPVYAVTVAQTTEQEVDGRLPRRRDLHSAPWLCKPGVDIACGERS